MQLTDIKKFCYSGNHNYLYIFTISSIDASALYSHLRFMFAKSLSIGLSSGEYGGKKSKLAPQAAISVVHLYRLLEILSDTQTPLGA